MFDPAPLSSEPSTQSRRTPDHPDPEFVPPLSDTGALLAAVGLSSRVIREILGNAAGGGAHG